MKRKIFGVVVLTLIISMFTAFSSMADEDSGYIGTGPATGVVSDIIPTHNKAASEVPATPEVSITPIKLEVDSNSVYTFEGKKYIIEKLWGQHCLTGYTSSGSATASGKWPKAHHTVAGPTSMLGKVCLVKGNRKISGNVGNLHNYDGIYVFEDTGGEAVENGTANTLNEPVVDIFFESYGEAYAVTGTGTIVADVYILKPIP